MAGAVANLAVDPNARAQLQAVGVVAPLVSLLSDGSPNAQARPL